MLLVHSTNGSNAPNSNRKIIASKSTKKEGIDMKITIPDKNRTGTIELEGIYHKNKTFFTYKRKGVKDYDVACLPSGIAVARAMPLLEASILCHLLAGIPVDAINFAGSYDYLDALDNEKLKLVASKMNDAREEYHKECDEKRYFDKTAIQRYIYTNAAERSRLRFLAKTLTMKISTPKTINSVVGHQQTGHVTEKNPNLKPRNKNWYVSVRASAETLKCVINDLRTNPSLTFGQNNFTLINRRRPTL